ncbi:MAG TPA: putative ABC exporter domain-containing protein [Thermoanaerobaculia bacterium]|nr:putative ABC exporter domain-containing protein [Thermoanaerobaculia bacterium]
MSAPGSATNALVFYATRSAGNAVRRRLKRLTEPRYLIGLAAGLAYVGLVLVRPGRPSARAAAAGPWPVEFLGVAQLAVAAILLLGTALLWIFRGSQASLSLSEGEAQFLFSAPLSRNAVVHFALVRSQLRVLSGVLIALLFSRPDSWTGLLRSALAGWIFFSVVNLHLLGVGFTKAAWAERPAGRRRATKVVVTLLALAALAFVVAAGTEALVRAAGAPAGRRGVSPVALEGAILTGTLGRPLFALLYPFRLLVAPLLAPGAGVFLRTLPGAVGLLVLHYVWVLGTNARFEDATLAGAARRAAERGRRERGNLPALPGERKRHAVPFRLAARGRPEVAIVWKNLAAWNRTALRSQLLGVAGLIAALFLAAALLRQPEADQIAGVVLVVLGVVGVILAPTIPAGLRNDLRGDLEQADVLKTWPVSPAALVVGEILAPLWITVLALFAGLGGALAVSAGRALRGAGGVAGPFGGLDALSGLVPVALAAVLFVPPFSLLLLLGQNAATLAFPAWFPPGQKRARGLEQFGIRLVAAVATVALLAIALLPSGLLVALVLLLGGKALGLWALPLSALLASLPVWAEAAAAVALLAKLWERFDPSLDLGA